MLIYLNVVGGVLKIIGLRIRYGKFFNSGCGSCRQLVALTAFNCRTAAWRRHAISMLMTHPYIQRQCKRQLWRTRRRWCHLRPLPMHCCRYLSALACCLDLKLPPLQVAQNPTLVWLLYSRRTLCAT
jgi:hypothetical protein